jgi:hypothetical protein
MLGHCCRSKLDRKRHRFSPRCAAFAATFVVAALTLSASARAQNAAVDTFVYDVKIVCATDDPKAGFDTYLGGTYGVRSRSESYGVLPTLDSYRTEVNVLNPTAEEAVVEARVVLAHEPGAEAVSSDPFVYRVAPQDAISVNCAELESRLAPSAVVPGGSGFVVMRADRELEVVAVYAVGEKTGCGGGPIRGGHCSGAGASIDVEYVKPRVVSGPRLPDLIVRFLRTPLFRCGPNQACTLDAWFEVRNGGGGDAGPFSVVLEADTFLGPEVIALPGLAAGAHQEFVRMLDGTSASAGCADHDCSVAVRADEFGEVEESDEANNIATAIAIESH